MAGDRPSFSDNGADSEGFRFHVRFTAAEAAVCFGAKDAPAPERNRI